MRYWWVNQNQTYRHEVGGGYLWSPKRNANGARNPFYESMREVAPGDLIFSFMDTRILAVGIAQSYCWESPKPLEFGKSGENWEGIGWRVKVHFTELAKKVRPKDHIDILRPLLPGKYSPLQPNGNGLQSVYLTEVPTALSEVLIGLIGQEIGPVVIMAAKVGPISTDDLDSWERKLEQGVTEDTSIPETARLAIVRARIGQGLFKERVGQIESKCRITGVENPAHLVASHCKPWRDSTNEERLDPTIRLVIGASAALDGVPPTVAHREFASAALRVNVFAVLIVRRLTGDGVEPTSRHFISPSPSGQPRSLSSLLCCRFSGC